MNPLIVPFVLIGLLAIAGVIAQVRFQMKLRRLRASGLHPEKGKESAVDVAKLKAAGETVLAVRCHRIVHGVGLKEAHEAVLGRTASPEKLSWLLGACAVVIAIAVFVAMQ
jgi:hypothetical protein